jgi:competence protein ComEC
LTTRFVRVSRKLFFALALCTLLIAIPSCHALPRLTTLQVRFLDVGQADSELIQCDGKSMLIDAGTNATATSLVATLKGLGITRFDVVVGTHPHEDHIGGLDNVISSFDIGIVYMPEVSADTDTFRDVLTAIKNKGLSITTPVPGTGFDLGKAHFTIFAPNSASYDDLNNYSIVLRMDYGNTSFLFTGDAQALSEQEMLTKGFNLKVDVLKVGHHGSSTSTLPAFLKAVSPRYAVIEVGKGNDYGHPAQVTLDDLRSAGVTVYRTDLNGTVTITSDGVSLNMRSER